MQRRWDQVFKAKLGKSERGYVNILGDIRNEWAHQSPFTNDQAYEAADIARRLLEAVGEPNSAATCGAIAQELLRLRFEAEQKQATKKTGSLEEAPTTTTQGLKPWRLVIKPHPDVASGRYIQAEFAADLAQVVQGKADPEYGDREGVLPPHLPDRGLGLAAGERRQAAHRARRRSGRPAPDQLRRRQDAQYAGALSPVQRQDRHLGNPRRRGDCRAGREHRRSHRRQPCGDRRHSFQRHRAAPLLRLRRRIRSGATSPINWAASMPIASSRKPISPASVPARTISSICWRNTVRR